jgi:hypothetical protein
MLLMYNLPQMVLALEHGFLVNILTFLYFEEIVIYTHVSKCKNDKIKFKKMKL